MSALGQKQTYALQQAMSALHPIATTKAEMPQTVVSALSGVVKTVARITSLPHFFGLFEVTISYPRELFLCRGIKR
jgi:hypothetical protein